CPARVPGGASGGRRHRRAGRAVLPLPPLPWECSPVNESRLRADALTLRYGPEPVVEGLSLDLPDHRITTILGPNACGKSTVLRSLARLLKPVRGAVYLDGHAIQRLPTKE